MKQHITPEDLEMLTEKGREKYRSFVLYLCTDDFSNKKLYLSDSYSYLLSIGQMIEYLDEQGFGIRHVNFRNSLIDYCSGDILYGEKIELCDALWQSCVQKLNT